MSNYYKGTRFRVYTANPELLPLAVYEVLRSSHLTLAKAQEAARPLLEEGKDVQIIKCGWEEVKRDILWLNSNNYMKEL